MSPIALAPIDPAERIRRRHRKDAFHLAASRNRMLGDPEDLEYDYTFNYLTSPTPGMGPLIAQTKSDLIKELATTGGDVKTARFLELMDRLTHLYDPSTFDARQRSEDNAGVDGMWFTLSRPNYPGCIGTNSDGCYLYTLGHMSFQMLPPTDLVCSIQASFNPVHHVRSKDKMKLKGVPKKLENLVFAEKCVLRSSDLVTAITFVPSDDVPFDMESTAPNRHVRRPIRAVMTTNGYMVADPDKPNRLLTWFTHTSLEVSDDPADQQTWRFLYGTAASLALEPRTSLRVSANKKKPAPTSTTTTPGLEDDGKLSIEMEQPINDMYLDVLYLDETIRIMRGNLGTVYVMARVPYFPDE